MNEDDVSQTNRRRQRRVQQERMEGADSESVAPVDPLGNPPETDSDQGHLSEASGSASDGRAESDESDESGASVKDTQVGTYMYLPRDQKKEIERLYTVLKAEYEYEFERDFEKNRHFFPLLVKYGLDTLEGSDVSEVQTKLDDMK